MFKALKARLFQGYRTGKFPPAPPNLPDRFRGKPEIISAQGDGSCCPTGAFDGASLDLGKCIFCGNCAGAVRFTREYRMGGMSREALLIGGESVPAAENPRRGLFRKLCSRSLKIRQVSAGGCNACELDFNVLGTLAWDMGRFGIQVVASPRHADCLLVTGPVTENMKTALKKCYDAMPEPRFVIACGACAVSGGLYAPEMTGAESVVPVDFFVPGCPPHPAVLLDAMLHFMGRSAGNV